MAETKEYMRPHMLYRYRSAKNLNRELETIEQGYLYCSPFENLNDPMEGLFSSTRRVRGDDNYRAMRRAITNSKAETGICPFSEVYDHELMWAHYADKFAGICVAYRFSKLLKHLPRDVTFVRMFYNEKVPLIRRRNDRPKELARMILSYKNLRWLYEREWRMFAPLGRVHYHDPRCVTRVYLGSRITPENREQVLRRMLQLRIGVREMNIEKYSLSFEPCK